jgi:beta-glucosidase
VNRHANTPTAFPDGFVWGVATAAYQIEGAADVDGRGESIWDRFCATEGKVHNGDSGAVACDFYHRYPEDVALMRDLGVTGFRFSIAWPRVVPAGIGKVNTAGLDFYDRLVDELLDAGIRPFPTLYHWDLPQRLEEAGGWPARATAYAFRDYAEAVVGRLGDRVLDWTTHNEPHVPAWAGYGHGVHAPGRVSVADALATAHHILLSHGLAAEVIRRDVAGARLGITLDLWPMEPASASPDDVAAAREADGDQNRWFLDPLYRGTYPEDMLDHFAPDAPPVEEGDMETIAAPLDFLGVNFYRREVVERARDGGRRVVHQPGSQYTEMGWEVSPQGLHDVLVRLRDDYAPAAIYVTENGAAFGDVLAHNGSVSDPDRVAYLAAHIDAARRALEAGVPLAGYFVWSLLDNFEWSFGYSKRFGLVYVDYPTLARIPKASFYWYRDFLSRTNGGAPSSPSPAREGVQLQA